MKIIKYTLTKIIITKSLCFSSSFSLPLANLDFNFSGDALKQDTTINQKRLFLTIADDDDVAGIAEKKMAIRTFKLMKKREKVKFTRIFFFQVKSLCYSDFNSLSA